MAFPMDQGYNQAFGDPEYSSNGVSIPESDLRSSSHQLYQYRNPDNFRNGLSISQQHQAHHPQFSGHGGAVFGLHQEYPNDAIMPDDNAFNGINEHEMTEQEMAAALASFQPCDDCTPATKTAIPHHHHPSGRLAGASAQLDGHYCCSWLVHDQPCFLCFASAEALDNHIKNDHAGKDGTYRCLWQNCSKHDTSTKTATAGPMNFGNKPKLMRHVHSHTGYKPFPCPYPGCDKGFVTKEQLKNHETTHTKARKYKCEQCGKAFAVKSALTTHITAVHDERKTHRCDLCGKAFADSSNLSKHKQTHFRDSAGVRKTRSKRTVSTSTRSTPSLPTPTAEMATPIMPVPNFHPEYSNPGLMAPPPSKLTMPSSASPFGPMPFSYATLSTASSPPPSESTSVFDPDCYCCEQQCPPPDCCEQQCPPPDGPPTPCPEDDDECDRDGFCDLPTCFSSPPQSMGYTSAAAYSCSGEPALMQQCHIDQLRNFQWEDLMGGEMEQYGDMHGS